MTNATANEGWRSPLLAHFSAASAAAGRLTVVSDPDGLLTEPGVVERLRERGFELCTFEDHIVFRFAYESRFRRHWDRGETTHLVVVIRTERGDLRAIPHDLLEEAKACGRVLAFSLVELFSSLSPNVVAQLDHCDFDALADALAKAAPGNLGENATRDFILRHVFEIAPELIKSSSDLLRVLLRRHYRSRVFPRQFDERFIEILARSKEWQSWPLERIVPSKEAFLTFLGERWPYFLASKGFARVPGREPSILAINGPVELPFDHDDVRVYIDNLFAEGLLEPTASIDAASVEGSWYRVGVVGSPALDAKVRLERLLLLLPEVLPNDEADHLAWSAFGQRWAEALCLRWQLESAATPELEGRLAALHDDVESRFARWMLQRYGSIHSLPHLPRPTTLDKVARYLAHHRNSKTPTPKLALLVVDGLALDQWLVLRESLAGLQLEEATAFAWVPTLTAVSRQALFAGEPPYFYAQSLSTTQKEPRHWARFWDDQGLRGPAVGYVCQRSPEAEDGFLARVREVAEHPQCKVLGLVVGTVDQMMHGTIIGMGEMHAKVRHWAKEGHFRTLVTELLQRGFEVFVTADHGNIEGTGVGKPNVGAIADERGERVHIFPHDLTRADVHRAFPGSILWPQVALPEDYRALMPPGRGAFVSEGARVVGHGGISLEEVLVPFVRISEGP
jgi:hypothetical protein